MVHQRCVSDGGCECAKLDCLVSTRVSGAGRQIVGGGLAKFTLTIKGGEGERGEIALGVRI